MIAVSGVLPVKAVIAFSADDLVIQGDSGVNDIIQPGLYTFNSLYPDYNIDLSVPESDPAATALDELKAGNIDIAMSGRALSSSDDPSHLLKDFRIGYQAIVMIVNADCPASEINTEQIKAIYEGAQSDWTDLGGLALTPRAMIAGSGLYQALTSENWFAGVSASLEADVIENTDLPRLESNEEMAAAIGENPDEIGYISLGYASYLDESVKCLNLGTSSSSGYIAPEKSNVYPRDPASENYPSRELHLFYRKSNAKTALSDYLDFMVSPVGQDELQLAGGVKRFFEPDLNGDGEVNLGDVVKIGLVWGETGDAGWVFEDLNQDGDINILDAVMVGMWWDFKYIAN